jgi:hypothetical protein
VAKEEIGDGGAPGRRWCSSRGCCCAVRARRSGEEVWGEAGIEVAFIGGEGKGRGAQGGGGEVAGRRPLKLIEAR